MRDRNFIDIDQYKYKAYSLYKKNVLLSFLKTLKDSQINLNNLFKNLNKLLKYVINLLKFFNKLPTKSKQPFKRNYVIRVMAFSKAISPKGGYFLHHHHQQPSHLLSIFYCLYYMFQIAFPKFYSIFIPFTLVFPSLWLPSLSYWSHIQLL